MSGLAASSSLERALDQLGDGELYVAVVMLESGRGGEGLCKQPGWSECCD